MKWNFFIVPETDLKAQATRAAGQVWYKNEDQQFMKGPKVFRCHSCNKLVSRTHLEDYCQMGKHEYSVDYSQY